jgi:hypothetical protein
MNPMDVLGYLRAVLVFLSSGLLVDTFWSMSWLQKGDIIANVYFVVVSLWCITRYQSKWTKAFLAFSALVYALEFMVDFHFYGHIYQYGFEPMYHWIGLMALASLVVTPFVAFLFLRWMILGLQRSKEIQIELIEKEGQDFVE